jgi:hypothetical protein
MKHVVLLGDSIFDNAAYVGDGPAVIDQLRGRLPAECSATLSARDGSTIADVHQQLDACPEASHLVLSVGGNDVLAEIGVLGSPAATVGEGLRKLAAIRTRFARDYDALLASIKQRAVPAVVCTIYEPRFPAGALQLEAVTALCLFNDALIRAALHHRLPVLELRDVCTADADFANPIEPSSTGGAKIVEAIIEMLGTVAQRSDMTFLGPDCLRVVP